MFWVILAVDPKSCKLRHEIDDLGHRRRLFYKRSPFQIYLQKAVHRILFLTHHFFLEIALISKPVDQNRIFLILHDVF